MRLQCFRLSAFVFFFLARVAGAAGAQSRIVLTGEPTAGKTLAVVATATVARTADCTFRLVVPPTVRWESGSPAWSGTIAPGAPVTITASVTPLRAGTSTVALRALGDKACGSGIIATESLQVAAAPRPRTVEVLSSELAAPSPKEVHPKIAENIIQAIREQNAQPGARESHGVKLDGHGRATVYLSLREGIDADELVAKIAKSHDVALEKRHGLYVRVTMPLGRIIALAETTDAIARISTPPPPQYESITGEGVNRTGAYTYHDRSILGSGTRVAIIDFGFANLANSIASGDLPSNVIRVDCTSTCVTTTYSGETDKHGTAVAEIVHEMAPSAQLYLIKVADGIDILDAATYCRSVGVDVINHSGGWVNYNFYDGKCWEGIPPYWQVGPVCASDHAINGGILWVNSAGNYAKRHYAATFTDSNSDRWHDTAVSLYIPAGQRARLYLTWDDWPLSTQDYDFYLSKADGTIMAYSRGEQNGDDLPTEAIFYTPTVGATYYLFVYKFGASVHPRFKIFSFDQDLSPSVPASSLTSPADGTWVVSTAAIPYTSYATASQPESFSSRGPTTDGMTAPIISGPDAVSGATLNPFSGTSASAPHVAGAAALLLSANPSWSWLDLWDELTANAIDMGSSGMDTAFGYGRLNLCLSPETPALSGPASAGVNEPYTLSWTATADKYELEESWNPNFTNANVYTLFETSFQRSYSSATTIYYRVRAVDTCNGLATQSRWSGTKVVTIQDIQPIVTVSASDANARETGSNSATMVFTRSGATTSSLAVSYTISGTATNGSDYSSLSGGLTIAAGQSSAIVTISPVDDALVENAETVTLTIAASSTYTIGSPAGASATIADNDGAVTVVASDSRGAESPLDNASFTVSRTGSTAESVTVTYSIGGTATNGTDYNTLSGSVVISAGAASAAIAVVPKADASTEGSETAIVTITSGTEYKVGSPSSATVTIDDVRRHDASMDFNGDNRSELIWRNQSTGALAMWNMNGRTLVNGAIFSTAVPDMNWKVQGFGDFNADGKDDILWRNAQTGQVAMWEMNGRTPLTYDALTTVSNLNWQIHAIGDFDGDQYDDIVWRNVSTGQVALWQLHGHTVLADGVVSTVPVQWEIQLAGDFDNDGRDELLWRDTVSGKLAMWDFAGRTPTNTYVFYTVADLNWNVAGVGDFNGDGTADLMWRNSSSGAVAMWEMNGRTIINGANVATVPDQQWVIERCGDFDSDGIDEIIWYHRLTGKVAMWDVNGHQIQNDSVFYTVSDLNWTIQPRGGIRPSLTAN